jgi:hypothetical protein
MIYGRFGNVVTILRKAVLSDVKTLDKRTPDKQDRDAIKQGSYVVVQDNNTKEPRLYHLAYLRADDGIREIDAAIAEVSDHV